MIPGFADFSHYQRQIFVLIVSNKKGFLLLVSIENEPVCFY